MIENLTEAEMSNGDERGEDNEETSMSEETNSADVNEDDTINEADRTPPRMFTFTCVNSYGNAEVDAIRDDGKPIKFSNR